MRRGRSPGAGAQRRRGFTLIEVVCALALMIFLFGGIYGIANAVLTLSRSSKEARIAELRLNNLDSLFRTAFESLPSNATFELTLDGEGGRGALTVHRAPGVLCWNSQFAVAGMISLRTEPDPRRRGGSRLVIEHWRESVHGERRPLGELRLVDGLDFARWRLLDPQTGQWESLWFQRQGRPLLAELTFRPADSRDAQRMVFWIPPYRSMQPAASTPARVPLRP